MHRYLTPVKARVEVSNETLSNLTGQEAYDYLLEYRRSVHFYCVARNYGLERLAMLSKMKGESLLREERLVK